MGMNVNGIDPHIRTIQNAETDGDDLSFFIGDTGSQRILGNGLIHGRNDLTVDGVGGSF